MAIIPHLGLQAESGHYIAITRCRYKTDSWMMFDGNNTRVIMKTSKMLKQYCNDAYLLFYKLVEAEVAEDTA